MTRDEATILKRSLLESGKAIDERGDCAVRALAAVTAEGYDKAHAALKNAGRKNRTGTYFHQTEKAIKAMGFDCESIPYRAKTVNTIQREKALQTGSYLIRMRRHILAMVDGQIVDATQGRNFRVLSVYRVASIAGFVPAIMAAVPFKPMAQSNTQQPLFGVDS